MANSDYSQTGAGSFCALIVLDTAVGRLDDTFSFTEFNYQYPDPVTVGMAAMIDEEIVRVIEIGIASVKVARGCADTIPAEHGVGALCWFFSTATGTDAREYSATQTIGVKVSPFTAGGGNVPLESIAPIAVTFNWRFARPYPPAQMKVNNARWWEVQAVTEAAPNFSMTWVDRDRILQADQLLGHDDPTIGPEPGCTYTMYVYDMEGTLLRKEIGLGNHAFNYQWPQMVNDFNYPPSLMVGEVHFTSTRNGIDAWQAYVLSFTVDPAGTLTSQYMGFDTGLLESPYRQNLVHALDPAASYLIGMAARPSDRMSDACDLLIDGTVDSFARARYTPWATSDFRLPELETTFNVRTSSMFDGVAIEHSNVGKLAAIGQEIVQIEAINDSQSVITLRRGCLDTVPQVHAPGARLWFIEQSSNIGTTPYNPGEPLTCRFRPGVYGPMIPEDALPSVVAYVGARSQRPYPPGQLVVGGRPWFEEATVVSGGVLNFSWARRNRITQGTDIYGHIDDDVPPEATQVTRLEFFYTTPSPTPGAAAVEHVLRAVNLVGRVYAYTYDMALADGRVAGLATGVCGTVLITVRITARTDAATSYQGYHVPLRLPSYPCA